MKEKTLSHFDNAGEARMVNVGKKPTQFRAASAAAEIRCASGTIGLLKKQALPKGDVLAVARIAGIQAAKRTADLIPLCHTLPLDSVSVDFTIHANRIAILASATTSAKTGVEMEALTAASIAALTLYDMLKAVDSSMRIGGIKVVKKIKA